MFARSVASPKGLRIEDVRVCSPGAAISLARSDEECDYRVESQSSSKE